MEIERFNYRDIQDVSTLLADCVPYVLPHHPYIYWIMGEYFPSLCFIAKENDSILGFICALYSAEKKSIFIWQLAVSKAHRRKGLAVLLCDKIVEYANNNKINSIQMTINDENTASLTFFSRFSKQHSKTFEKITLSGINSFKGENAYEIKL